MNPIGGLITIEPGNNVYQLPYTPSYIRLTAAGGLSDTTTSRKSTGIVNVDDLYQAVLAQFNNTTVNRGEIDGGISSRCVFVLKSDGSKWIDAELTNVDDVNDRITIYGHQGDDDYPVLLEIFPPS